MHSLQLVPPEHNMKPTDPREQDVYHLPRPLIDSPIHVQALRGDVEPETCSGCGHPIRLHYDTTGCFFIGCEGAVRRIQLGLLHVRVGGGIDNVDGNQHPKVAETIRAVLLVGCGVMSSIYCELSYEQQVQIARTVALRAVTAHLSETGGR